MKAIATLSIAIISIVTYFFISMPISAIDLKKCEDIHIQLENYSTKNSIQGLSIQSCTPYRAIFTNKPPNIQLLTSLDRTTTINYLCRFLKIIQINEIQLLGELPKEISKSLPNGNVHIDHIPAPVLFHVNENTCKQIHNKSINADTKPRA